MPRISGSILRAAGAALIETERAAPNCCAIRRIQAVAAAVHGVPRAALPHPRMRSGGEIGVDFCIQIGVPQCTNWHIKCLVTEWPMVAGYIDGDQQAGSPPSHHQLKRELNDKV
jgi:hypothetical protein